MTMLDFCKQITKSTFATIEVETSPDVTATCPFNNLKKISRVNGVINFSYESSVNNQRLRESNPTTEKELNAVEKFSADVRKWGVRLKGTPLVEHKGEYYLEMKVQNVYNTEYMVDGKPIEADLVKPYLRKKRDTRQKVENPVILRDYKLSNIRSLKANGTEFVRT